MAATDQTRATIGYVDQQIKEYRRGAIDLRTLKANMAMYLTREVSDQILDRLRHRPDSATMLAELQKIIH